MKKMFIVVVAVGALALGGGATALASTASSASQTGAQVDQEGGSKVPTTIQVPVGNHRIANFQGDGVQTYGCVNGAWTFIRPAASLTDGGRPTAIHYAGVTNPQWQSIKDGSSVGAQKSASVDQPGAVPQLLLKAVENTGNAQSQFGRVTWVQRLNTSGGLAPAGKCATGDQVGVHYSADYAFWVKD